MFFRQSAAFLKHVKNPEDYCLMAIDIEHFKLFNDWYGQEAGDRLLAMIGRTSEQDAVGGGRPCRIYGRGRFRHTST
ncbi:MAG: diguanylate cyclase domain-containing protein [Enterocloster sp.]